MGSTTNDLAPAWVDCGLAIASAVAPDVTFLKVAGLGVCGAEAFEAISSIYDYRTHPDDVERFKNMSDSFGTAIGCVIAVSAIAAGELEPEYEYLFYPQFVLIW